MAQFRTVIGTRWSCQGCAFCCHHQTLGPVDPETIERLDAAPLTEFCPSAAQGAWKKTIPTSEGEQVFLAKKNGACIFLSEEKSCLLHQHLGPASKPVFCRVFPFVRIDDPRESRVGLRSDCGGIHESLATGQPMEAQTEHQVLLPGNRARGLFAPSTVQLLPGDELELEAWLDLEEELMAGVSSVDATPGGHVAGIRRRLESTGLLKVHQPDFERARIAARASLLGLQMITGQILKTQTAPEASSEKFLQARHDQIQQAIETMGQPLAPLSAEAREWLRQDLLNHLFIRDWSRQGSLGHGLGLWLLGTWLCRTVAEPDPNGVHQAAALAAVRVPWLRLLLNQGLQPVLRKIRPATADLFCMVS